jgi:hypothetical protein
MEMAYTNSSRMNADAAIAQASRARELAPDDGRTLRELALACSASPDHLDEALRTIEHAIELDDAEALNWAVLGRVRIAAGNALEAAMAAERALAIDAYCVEAHLVLGDAALAFEGWSEADRIFERVLKLAPGNQKAIEARRSIGERNAVKRAAQPSPPTPDERPDADPPHDHARTPAHAVGDGGNGRGGPPADPDPAEGFPPLVDAAGGDVGALNGEVLDTVRRHLDAFNRRDIAAILDGFTDDAVFRTGGDLLVGVDAIHELFSDTFAASADTRLHLRSAVVQNGTAACELTEQIELAEDVDDVYERELVGLYTVHSGRIVRVRLYGDE